MREMAPVYSNLDAKSKTGQLGSFAVVTDQSPGEISIFDMELIYPNMNSTATKVYGSSDFGVSKICPE